MYTDPKKKCRARRLVYGVLAQAMLLAGCAPPVAIPVQADMPTQWSTQSAPTPEAAASISQPDWWRNFNDPGLDQLINEALLRNNDLAAAAVRVYQAKAQAKIADLDRGPSVLVGMSGNLSVPHHADQQDLMGNLAVSVSYEVDLWGKLAAQHDAAVWEAQATEQDLQAAHLALIGTTATLYWQLAYLNQQIALSNADIVDTRRIVELAESRHQAGAASELDVAQARQTLTSLQAEATQLAQQRTECRHALAILFDRPPQDLAPERDGLPEIVPLAIPAGLPADLLRHRPDLRAAEFRLRASFSDVQVARTSFYPSVILTGGMGTSSDALLQLIRNPVATLGIGLTLPFIEWNKMQQTIKVSQAEYEQAVIGFRQNLYRALSEVENALSACTQLDAQRQYQGARVAQAARAETLARARFRAGATGIEPWLTQRRALRDAQRAQLQSRLDTLVSQMTLYQVLGGGYV